LAQLCNLIPGHLVGKLARETGVETKARTFSAWSHVVAVLYAQLTHAIGLNDVCDAPHHHTGWLSRIRGATPPSRNGFSHANKHRDAAMAERLFWTVLAHLQSLQPQFGARRRFKGLTGRFKRVIHVVDSTTIQLVASCLDWAKHRRRKAAAKCHLRLDLQSLLPRFAIVDPARDHDAGRAREVCAGIRAGEIVIFDRAYVDFPHLFGLLIRDVFWVTRTKTNVRPRVVKKRLRRPVGNILRDDEVVLVTAQSRGEYPNRLRRVTALVELDGKQVEMEFLTNNFVWSPATVADLYRCRWLPSVATSSNRGFLQADQTNPAAVRLPRPLRQRRALAGLDRPAALRAAALPSLPARLVSQLHPAVHPHPRRRLGPLPSAGPARFLWDSTRTLAHVRPARPGLPPRSRTVPCGTARNLTAPFLPRIMPKFMNAP